MVCLNGQDQGNLPLRLDGGVGDIRPRKDPTRGAAQQGRRPPHQRTATGESQWSAEQPESRETASAPRHGCRRHEGDEHDATEGPRLSPPQPAPVELHNHKTGTRNHVELQLWTLHGHKDHGDRPLHQDRNVNDLDELQMRKTAAISQRDATVGARMSSPRRHLRECTACVTGTSTTKYERRQ